MSQPAQSLQSILSGQAKPDAGVDDLAAVGFIRGLGFRV